MVQFPFLLFCFEFVFFIPLKKQPKTRDTAKKHKKKNQKCRKKRTICFQLAQLCSEMVFLIFWCGLKNADFAENTIQIVVSACFEKKEKCQKRQKGWVKTWSKVESKLGPSMLRNIIGPSFDSKNGNVVLLFFFWRISFSLQKEEELWKKAKRGGKQNLDQVLTPKKAIFEPSFD